MRTLSRLCFAFVRSPPAGKHYDGDGLWLVKREMAPRDLRVLKPTTTDSTMTATAFEFPGVIAGSDGETRPA